MSSDTVTNSMNLRLREFYAQFEISYVAVVIPSGGSLTSLVGENNRRWLLRFIPIISTPDSMEIVPNKAADLVNPWALNLPGVTYKYNDDPDFCQSGWQAANVDFIDQNILVIQTLVRP